MYKTDEFGAIKNTEHGLEVTENASLTTISIALMLASEAMEHKPLIINGTATFRKSVLEAAFQANLPISFQNKLLQRALESKKENQENERKNFLVTGGKIISKRPNIKPAVAPSHAKRVEDATKKGFRMPTLSERTMVYSKSRGTDVLLQADEFNGMDEYARECNKRVRWIIVNKVDKKLERGEKFRFKIIRGKKIDSRMRTIRIVKSVNIPKQGNL